MVVEKLFGVDERPDEILITIANRTQGVERLALRIGTGFEKMRLRYADFV